MQITIFGASGKVGRQVVALALAEGHDVRVFVHRHNPFAEQAKVTVFTGDITDQAAVAKALKGSQAVISTLGSWHTPSKDILRTSMATILPTMQAAGIKRIITLTGAGAFSEEDKPGFVDRCNHAILRLVAPKILDDGEAHLKLLASSNLDWTCIRSPIMTRRQRTGYKLIAALPMPWATIPRRAVSRCLVDQLTDTTHPCQAPVIRRA